MKKKTKKEMDRYADRADIPSASDSLSQLYGGGNSMMMMTKADWANWNKASGNQGYWLLGASAVLIVLGMFLSAKKPYLNY